MALQGVVGYQYAEKIKTLLDSFRITGLKGFGFVIRALLSRVLLRKEPPRAKPIPKAILEKAQDVRDMLDEASMWIPMDPERKKDSAYRLEVLKIRKKFKKTIHSMTQEKVKELKYMPYADRKALVAKHQQILDLKMKQALAFAQAKQKVKQRTTVTSNQYVEERKQIFTNLEAPFNGQGLSPGQLANMSILLDRELFPYEYMPVLTADMALAHWVSSTPIFKLIDEGFLKQRVRSDLILMTEPDAHQMKLLSAFSAAIIAGYVLLNQAVELKINDDALKPLLDASLQKRLEDKVATNEDLSIFNKMGLDVRQSNNRNKLK